MSIVKGGTPHELLYPMPLIVGPILTRGEMLLQEENTTETMNMKTEENEDGKHEH